MDSKNLSGGDIAKILVLGIIMLGGYVAYTSSTDSATGADRVTMASYSRLEEGMSYEQASRVLGGPGTEISRVEMSGISTVMYQWTAGYAGRNMNATFQDDKLISKAQLGLR